eukprot:TRINITY_DN277_c0_g1_i2.p1 TRINITY_DN277_c0_g1~~TRINITY_DN277_c0_g1_i2.p1  ORF type:complete len:139 (-),score=13.44 TRINITY_DN277_c0_g1_i2:1637-2053(-)
MVPGRTDNATKNRFSALSKGRMSGSLGHKRNTCSHSSGSSSREGSGARSPLETISSLTTSPREMSSFGRLVDDRVAAGAGLSEERGVFCVDLNKSYDVLVSDSESGLSCCLDTPRSPSCAEEQKPSLLVDLNAVPNFV